VAAREQRIRGVVGVLVDDLRRDRGGVGRLVAVAEPVDDDRQPAARLRR
jgi:hypothetical protein